MNKLDFTETSHVFGDCTQCFDVSFSDNMTLDDFVKAVLSQNRREWGYIYYQSFKHEIIEYRYGDIVSKSNNYNSIKDNTISVVSSNGGWSRMDYIVDKQ